MSLERNLPTYAVASFVGDDCVGNPHRVAVNPPRLSRKQQPAWLNAGDDIVVLLFTASTPRVEFYQFGQLILRCGSGTLAAAHVMFRELRLGTEILETPAGQVALKQQGEWLGYRAKSLPIRVGDTSSDWQALLNQPIKNLFKIGGERDYCLLALNNEKAVANCAVDIEKLKATSDRALIITAPAARSGYDYVLRYFAPHHGKAEDPATGSANLQLASFWCERLNKTHLHGRQLSKGGGEFILEVDGDYTWVMGKTKSMNNEQ